jgi:hypothetical protein
MRLRHIFDLVLEYHGEGVTCTGRATATSPLDDTLLLFTSLLVAQVIRLG